MIVAIHLPINLTHFTPSGMAEFLYLIDHGSTSAPQAGIETSALRQLTTKQGVELGELKAAFATPDGPGHLYGCYVF